jgi:hypothetical protein
MLLSCNFSLAFCILSYFVYARENIISARLRSSSDFLIVLMDKLIIDSTEAKRATLIKTYWRVPRFVRVKIEIVIAECISISMDTNRIPFKRA